MKILITGGAGFIGTHLRRALEAEGHEVVILDNLTSQVHGPDPRIDRGASEFIRGDVRDGDAVRNALRGVDVVYHLASETGVGQSQYEIERYVSTNTLGTAVVLQAAAEVGVKQIIISSSRAVYGNGVHECGGCGHRFVPGARATSDLEAGDWEVKCEKCGSIAEALLTAEGDPAAPVSVYGVTKLQQEQIAQQVRSAYSIPITNLRFFNVFGPGQSLSNPYVGVLGTFYRRIKQGLEIDIYEDGQMRRDFVYVGDIVKALLLSAGNETTFNATVNVGTGIAVTLEEAGLEMFRIIGREPEITYSGKFRVGDIHHAVADTSLCKSVLDFVPGTTFSEGLRAFIDWADGEPFDLQEIDKKAEAQLAEKNLLGRAVRRDM